ncbi:MAG: phosphoglucomutase/phosphomannomutase family protein [Anaerolineae bacterium]|nr:phosphoglucomutase/phosphomannomutase family protein [Anaerolineae bacterium]MDW8099603.1 phosphoglucomutase/phosphomannomutase family protein [Anaerolineae bacterium]
METPIRFGTDGWRGRIADDYTFANVRRCAQGFATYLKRHGRADAGVIIGYDRRFGSEHFAAAVAEVMAGNGIRAFLTKTATPTPAISYNVVARQAGGAVNITASHNPPTDNGFKVRGPTGGAIDPEGLQEIEAAIPSSAEVLRMDLNEALSKGLVEYFDPAPAYLEQLHRLIDVEPIRQAGFTIVADAMWGNGAGWLERLIGGGKTRIIPIHYERNPLFPEMSRPEPIRPNVDPCMAKVREVGADVGIITDGDADRLGVVDERGNFVDQLRVYGLLALYLLEVRGERGPIVKTLSTTSMLNKLGQLYDVPVYETGVGFKYVAPKMIEVNALIGGEESGGYAFRHHVPERDGILAGLYLLDFMVRTGKSVTQLVEFLFSKVGPHYYDRIDTVFPIEEREAVRKRVIHARPERIGGLRVTGIDTTDGFKFHLEDGGWMLIRFSGTEPVIRVYTETTRQDAVLAILDDGLSLAGLGRARAD